ncbi:hypothetical protein OXPF_33410 [Oxobacter pfennigii]|uniref:PsbP C-terminal domain-containing protein n=1 Tax=Oxobacter pfennigii TaxID=36849 RepID=A0A0P8YTS0_9CLOT|nr:hypothetical protein [Oxobacter pfennigii]KPU43091.1 hypothetical protein OXPF_33410 [Oxobacter pfennigii]
MVVIDMRSSKRRALIVVCLILIIVVIFLARKNIETYNAITLKDINYKAYTGLNGMLSYKLPADWSAQEQNLNSTEIVYHMDFETKDKKIHGYVEILNFNKPLINFLNESKKNLLEIISFKQYTIEPIKIDGADGYILMYSKRSNNKYIKAFEVFRQDKDNIFHRFAFYMDEQEWENELRPVLLEIAASAVLK